MAGAPETHRTPVDWGDVGYIVVIVVSVAFAFIVPPVLFKFTKRVREGDAGRFPTGGRAKVVTIRVAAPAEAVRTASREALTRLHRASILVEDEGRVMAKTGLSFRSYGEFVQVEIQPDQWVVIRSTPIVGTTLIDHGKNRDNVRRIAQALHAADLTP